MDAKNLERLLASHGAGASGIAVVVQKLRAAFKVSVGGRGFNAHDLTASEISWIVATYLGSETPARASETLARLLKLRATVAEAKPKEFILCFDLILRRDIKRVREIRIARNADFAQIIFDKGAPWTFANWRAPNAALPMLRSEGVLSAGLIEVLADNVVVDDDQSDDKVIESRE
jgi:hypothetical protein